MENLIRKENAKQFYSFYYFCWGYFFYFYFSAGYLFCKRIWINLSNEYKVNKLLPDNIKAYSTS